MKCFGIGYVLGFLLVGTHQHQEEQKNASMAAVVGTNALLSGGVRRVERLAVNQPIINVELLPTNIPHGNINGPSMIRVPSFVQNPLGTYYLYFSHHDGKVIQFAYAHSVGGPYTVHPTGSLKLEQVTSKDICRNHIASPDVVIDHEKQEIRMYYHCPAAKEANFKVRHMRNIEFYVCLSTFYLFT